MTDITREAVEARVALLLSDYAADGAAVDAGMLLELVNDRDRLAEKLAEARKWARDAIFFDSEYVKAVDQRANEIAAVNAILRRRLAELGRLVVRDPREAVAEWMIRHGYAPGRNAIPEDLLAELVARLK